MEINDLINKLQGEFEEVPPGVLKPATKLSDIPDWSSMHALIVIALADMEYGVTIRGEELRKAQSIEDLYNLIVQKQNNPA
jgi:acyl carrier protein